MKKCFCGKHLTVVEIDEAEGLAWLACPEYMEGNDEHESYSVELTKEHEDMLFMDANKREHKIPKIKVTEYIGNGDFAGIAEDGTKVILGYGTKEVREALANGEIRLTQKQKEEIMEIDRMVAEAQGHQNSHFGNWNF